MVISYQKKLKANFIKSLATELL